LAAARCSSPCSTRSGSRPPSRCRCTRPCSSRRTSRARWRSAATSSGAPQWRAAGWFLLTAAPTPFLVAPYIVDANVHVILLLLAGLILVSLIPAKDGAEPLAPVPAVLLAGFLNGTLGMFVSATGLFVGRLFLRPEWSKETVIATLALTQTLGHLLRILGFASVGFAVTAQLEVLVPLLLATVAGTFAGRRLHEHLDEARFRALFKGILVVLSMKLAYDGVTGLLGWN
jgi:uncharacterized protein